MNVEVKKKKIEASCCVALPSFCINMQHMCIQQRAWNGVEPSPQ